MVKETEKFDQERRVRSTRFAHFWWVPEGDIGYLLALAGGINPRQVSAISLIGRLGTSEQGSSLASCRAFHSFTQAHRGVSKVQRKTCLLGEQRTRATSILTLSWRIPDEPPRWKVVAERWDTGFLASRGDEFNLGPETGWIAQSFCVIKFY